MKPISEWTDTEIRAEKAWGSPHSQDLADEVLRLRDEVERWLDFASKQSAATGELNAELARCRAVVDAALAWQAAGTDPTGAVALDRSVDTYRTEGAHRA